MNIEDTIQTLVKVRQSIDKWVPQRSIRPDALVNHLNDLYVESAKNRRMDELFEHDDVGSPSITLVISIDAEFDLKKVMGNMRTKLSIRHPGPGDEIGNAGVVWSHGRYDFVYDSDAGSLRISHGYSNARVHTRSVSSIAKQMIDYALDYLQEVKASAKKTTGGRRKDNDIRLPRESKA